MDIFVSPLATIMPWLHLNSKMILITFAVSSLVFFVMFCGRGKKLSRSIDPPKRQDKINSDGKYLPFFGYTVISNVDGQYDYSKIEQFLKETKTLSKYLAPLPASSYHVTIFDIFTHRNVPEKYVPLSGNVPSEHWTNSLHILQDDLTEAKKICSTVTKQFFFRKTEIQMAEYFGSASYIVGHLTDEDHLSEVRQQLSSIFPSMSRSVVPYHLTLGYLFKEIDDDNDKELIKKELDELWKLISDEYPLKLPDVHYFESMSEFIPWFEPKGHRPGTSADMK